MIKWQQWLGYTRSQRETLTPRSLAGNWLAKPQASSSRMRDINHNWSATKHRLHPQSVAEISRHLLLSGDRIRQCGTSSGSRHKDTLNWESITKLCLKCPSWALTQAEKFKELRNTINFLFSLHLDYMSIIIGKSHFKMSLLRLR